MKSNKTIMSLAIVALLLTAGIATTYAYQDDDFQKNRPSFLAEQQETVKKALKDNDYQTWLKLMRDHPMAQDIDENDFAILVEAQKLRDGGKFDEARKLMQESEIKLPGMGMHMRKGPYFSPKQDEAVKIALNNNDYAAWLEAVGTNSSIAEKINEGNFPKLVEAHKLMEQVRQIMDELGLKRGQGLFAPPAQ